MVSFENIQYNFLKHCVYLSVGNPRWSFLVKIVNDWKSFTIFEKKLKSKCSTGFQIKLTFNTLICCFYSSLWRSIEPVPCKYDPVRSQKYKHYNNLWNVLKVKNKGDVMTSFRNIFQVFHRLFRKEKKQR